MFELSAYVSCTCVDGWPILAYAHYAQNADARDLVTGSEEDTGWGVGFEVGDKTNVAKLGFGYYRLEADYFPSQFIDSDLTDGRTNRKGWTVYGSKSLWSNTDLNVTLFVSEELEDGPAFSGSVADADRMRLQTDLVVKF